MHGGSAGAAIGAGIDLHHLAALVRQNRGHVAQQTAAIVGAYVEGNQYGNALSLTPLHLNEIILSLLTIAAHQTAVAMVYHDLVAFVQLPHDGVTRPRTAAGGQLRGEAAGTIDSALLLASLRRCGGGRFAQQLRELLFGADHLFDGDGPDAYRGEQRLDIATAELARDVLVVRIAYRQADELVLQQALPQGYILLPALGLEPLNQLGLGAGRIGIPQSGLQPVAAGSAVLVRQHFYPIAGLQQIVQGHRLAVHACATALV